MKLKDVGLSAALDFCKRGFSVIPIKAKGKTPLVSWTSYKDRKATTSEINAWWNKYRNANIAIVTGNVSNLVVIDCDSQEAVERFLQDYPEVANTRRVQTGRAGGKHFYFRWEDGIKNHNSTVLGPKIDVKSDGGYVVAPPSIHSNGATYEWFNRKPIQALPTKLKKLLTGRNKTYVRTGTKTARRKSIKKGQRNSHLASVVGRLHAKGIDKEAILAAVLSENKNKCNPPLSDEEVTGVVNSITRYPVSVKSEELLTDAGNARRFAAQHSDKVRYCHIWRKWLIWDGTRWRKDETNEVYCRAIETIKAMYVDAANVGDGEIRRKLSTHAIKSEAAYAINAMLSLARNERSIAIAPSELDSDPSLLNVRNGTINLKTGKLERHNRDQLITKLAPVDYLPESKCQQWLKFLNHVMNGKQDMIEFLQRTIGYSLTGHVREQKLCFLYGTGANGKSTFLTIVQEMLGDYAKQAAPELLVTKYGSSHPTEVADLQGSRFVVAVEVEEGKRMAEALVKQMTGGDKIKARFMHQDFFEFQPTHKLFLAANHRPIIHGTDDGIWRRIMLVPFTVTIPEGKQDKELLEKLRKELPGILAWAVKGCVKWQVDGLKVPTEVTSATTSYRSEMDTIETFLNDRCVRDPKNTVRSGRLYEAYTTWCDQNGERFKYNQKSLTRQLQDRGFASKRRSEGFIWVGIGLKRDEEEYIAA